MFTNYGMNAQSDGLTVNLPDCMKNALMRQSCKVAYSVIETCRQHSGGKSWERLTEIMQDVTAFSFTGHCTNGDGLQIIIDVYDTITKCIEIDVKTGKITYELNCILYPTAQQTDFYPFTVANGRFCDKMMSAYMSKKREVPYISQRVVIKKQDSAKIETRELSPRQIANRKAREYVESHACPDTRRQKAVYIDGMTSEEIDGMVWNERLYYKIDFAENEDTSQEMLAKSYEISDYIAEMQLTAVQADVLRLRLQRYGIQAIATYRGKSKQAVAKTLAQIAEKARKCGLFHIAENDVAEMNIFAELCDMCGDENNVFTNKTPCIVPEIPTETAGDRYAKNTYLREKRAENLRIMFAFKNAVARQKASENERICCENEYTERVHNDKLANYFIIEHAAKHEFKMYAR